MPPFDVAIIGPYLRHNFGDDLIGAVIAKAFARERGKSCVIPGFSRENCEWLGCAYSESAVRATIAAKEVVVGGGGILGHSGSRPCSMYLRRGLRAASIARLLGKPVVVTGVGAGPLVGKVSRSLCRSLCACSQRIGVRDQDSRDFLVNDLCVPERKIVVGADVALLWPHFLDVTVPATTSSQLIGVQCDAVGFTDDASRPKVDFLHQRLADLCAKNASDCVTVSNSVGDTSLVQHLSTELPAIRYRTLYTFLSSLANLRCIITTHLHLAIAAYALRIPSISIYVREKTARFYKQIGRTERAISIADATFEGIERLILMADKVRWTSKDEAVRESLIAQARQLLAVATGPHEWEIG